MKGKLLLILAFTAVSLSSCMLEECDKSKIDFTPEDIIITLSDVTGNDLLNPATPNNILSNDINILYNGTVYKPASIPSAKGMTKADPIWKGMRIEYSETVGKYAILFGEFTPRDTYVGEEFTINWGDEKAGTGVVKFNYFAIYNGCDAKEERKTYYNDAAYSISSLTVNVKLAY